MYRVVPKSIINGPNISHFFRPLSQPFPTGLADGLTEALLLRLCAPCPETEEELATETPEVSSEANGVEDTLLTE